MNEIEKELERVKVLADCLELFSRLYGDDITLERALSEVLGKLSKQSASIYGQAWIHRPASGGFFLETDRIFYEEVSASVLKTEGPNEEKGNRSAPSSASLLAIRTIERIVWKSSYNDDYAVPPLAADRIRSVLTVPILADNSHIGTLLLYSSSDSPEEVETLGAYLDCVVRHLGSLIAEKNTRRSLRESESRMRKVLENMPILFMAVDESFRLVSWNHECERVMGYSQAEVIGKDDFLREKLFRESGVSAARKMDATIFDSDFKNWELELLAKDGKTKTIFLSNLSSEFPLPGWEKWFVGVDITHTKEIERELKGSLKELSDFQTALNAVSIVAFTDRAGTIIYVNQNFCNISGYSRDELLGQNHRIINSGYHSKEFFRELWSTISKGKIWKGEIKNKAKDGRFYWVDTTISPILDENGKPYQYLAIRNDITERKETEEKARHAENNLKTLQDRMSPHFLFNTLSIIHSYLQTNPSMADSAILMLADNYRFLTDHANKQLVSFDVEWEFMENYLQLLKLRFSDFLDVRVEKIGNFSKCTLPPLTLQPIVENSYLHGLRNKKGKGTIWVRAFLEGTKTFIVVRDDGVGLKDENIHSRTLMNISERLKFYLYESEVKIENHPEGGAVVTVTFDNRKNEELPDLQNYDRNN
ncbi:PAS domain S-box protein [Leptospira gomenensis]|uniref:PAS domain S-box protein n=1 Tax=Leptospira gomenensis TaxID=2484974 RepID=A0A5F1YFM8_9LEPT|nr:PAS domain S-box protein [Leptospira gomenensis]TGK32610.1 PAS domain S-box protein [Leptospira gomenensis]TGK38340.1 PAS domain S-box protein [Leptospira gomenensis]TGK52154.1 PAS domain S-box protein [Leptospira gomenensis]TGK62992.1 PAS domain S-box protein [Leptospira gomenensis]